MMMVMTTMRMTMMMMLLPKVVRAASLRMTLTRMMTSLRVERNLPKKVAQLPVATSRSANSNEIKQFKMMLKIYHNDN
jgi:hypothetical protein